MVFLITGPDTYRARQQLIELKEKFCREVDPSGLNVVSLIGTAITRADISNLIGTAPLLARRRFIVFEGLLAGGKTDVLDAIPKLLEREEAAAQSNVIVFFEAVPPTKKHALVIWLTKHARRFQFPLLTGDSLTRWLDEQLKRHKRTATLTARRQLLAATGADTWRLASELAKLDAALEPEAIVDESAIAAYVSTPAEDDTFGFVDAVMAGDVAHATRLLLTTLDSGTSAQQLIALLEKSLRVMLVLANNSENRQTLVVHGVHPYVVRKLVPLARRYNKVMLIKVYKQLAATDLELKTSSGDPRTLLLMFLLNVARART